MLKQVQRHALLTVGNLAFCWENRRTLVASESLRDLLLRQASGTNAIVCKAAARALAILGMFLTIVCTKPALFLACIKSLLLLLIFSVFAQLLKMHKCPSVDVQLLFRYLHAYSSFYEMSILLSCLVRILLIIAL